MTYIIYIYIIYLHGMWFGLIKAYIPDGVWGREVEVWCGLWNWGRATEIIMEVEHHSAPDWKTDRWFSMLKTQRVYIARVCLGLGFWLSRTHGYSWMLLLLGFMLLLTVNVRSVAASRSNKGCSFRGSRETYANHISTPTTGHIQASWSCINY